MEASSGSVTAIAITLLSRRLPKRCDVIFLQAGLHRTETSARQGRKRTLVNA